MFQYVPLDATGPINSCLQGLQLMLETVEGKDTSISWRFGSLNDHRNGFCQKPAAHETANSVNS